MTEKEEKYSLHRCRTSDALAVYNGQKTPNSHVDRFKRIRKSLSLDSSEKEKDKKSLPSSTGSFQRRTVTTVRVCAGIIVMYLNSLLIFQCFFLSCSYIALF